MSSRPLRLAALSCLFLGFLSAQESSDPAPVRAPSTESAPHELPLVFVENRGQVSERVRFHARVPGMSAAFVEEGFELSLAMDGVSGASASVHFTFDGASDSVEVVGTNPLAGHVSFLGGSDPEKWVRRAPTFAGLRYVGLYDGIDLVVRESNGRFEYDLVVAPGADPSVVVLSVEGGELSVGEDGVLSVRTAAGTIEHRAPFTWQVHADGREEELASRYRLLEDGRFGFVVEGRDADLPVVVDPVLVYRTYVGGSNADEARAVAVDPDGAFYVTGWSNSGDFPIGSNAVDARRKEREAVVFKLDPTGQSLEYATYFGGNGDDRGHAIAVNPEGEVYVAGQTRSNDFPVTNGTFDVRRNGGVDAFVLHLDATGSVIEYATYLGGRSEDVAYGIAVDSRDNAYVVGSTKSNDFPVTSAPFQAERDGGRDAFVTKLDDSGSIAIFSTFLGGKRDDGAAAVALDDAGHAYITGSTQSANFPTSTGALDPARNGTDAFVTKMGIAGNALIFSTFLGGSDKDAGLGIDVDYLMNVYVAGWTQSRDFPTTEDCLGPADAPRRDGFATKLTPSGSAIAYSSYVGGEGVDVCTSVAVDAFGVAWFVGHTTSDDFPVTPDAWQGAAGGAEDAFAVQLATETGSLLYGTLLGGRGKEQALGVDVGGAQGDVAVVGFADQVPAAERGELGGRGFGATDGLVVRLGPGRCGAPGRAETIGLGCGAALTSRHPRLGGPMEFRLSGASPNAQAIVVAGPEATRPSNVENLCEVYVDLGFAFPLEAFRTDAEGNYVLEGAIPDDAELCGLSLVVQGVVFAPGDGPLSFGQVTDAVRVVFGD